MTEGAEDLQLDPELWKDLPEELLERVIAKLPFARVVAFRTVCKRWYSNVIPCAAAHLEASGGSALPYFSYYKPSDGDSDAEEFKDHIEENRGYAWYLQLCNANKEWSDDSFQNFRPRSFPSPRAGQDVQLLLCEWGLLFFGFISREDGMTRDVVVCNPLISQSKSLGLPRPLLLALKGVVFDSEMRSYCLVLAGLDETLLYHSSTSTWTNVSSLSALNLNQAADNKTDCSVRGVCCNGHLYWYIEKSHWYQQRCVLKFDIQNDTWSVIPDLFECDNAMCDMHLNIVSYKEEILLWHFHWDLCYDGEDEDWKCLKCDDNQKLDSETKLVPMPRDMMGNAAEFLSHFKPLSLYYEAFGQRNFIYHVAKSKDVFSILVHNTDENTYTKSPGLIKDRFPSSALGLVRDIWSFSPSLTSVP